MKQKNMALCALIVISLSTNSFSGESSDNNDTSDSHSNHHQQMQHHNGEHQQLFNIDNRTSLNLSPQVKLHQLANMRAHLNAIRTITGLIATNEFDQAAKIASSQLGMTEEMKGMCSSFGNEKFERLGMAFHQSGDDLATVLKTHNPSKSLEALSYTMSFCVECHAEFRQ